MVLLAPLVLRALRVFKVPPVSRVLKGLLVLKEPLVLDHRVPLVPQAL